MITHITLQSNDGSYLVAEGGGGREVLANRDGIGPWETFCLFNRSRPGEQPSQGDSIVLQAWNGRFVSAEGGGGGAVNAALGWIEPSTTFTLEKISGSGTIRSGEQLALRSSNGNYFVAEGGGGGVVNANRARRGLWETFTIKIFQTQLIRLRSSVNRYVTAEDGGGGEVTANREGVGLWETFSLINLSRSDRSIYDGNSIALSAWNTNYVRTAGSDSVDCRANRATQDALFKVVAANGGEVHHGQRLSLQSLRTSQFLVARDRVLFADSPSVTDETQFTIEFAEQRAIDFSWIPDGTALPGRPFESPPSPVSGTKNLVTWYYHNNVAPPITASTAEVADAIFGRAPSLAAWLETMSDGVFGVRNAGTFGSIEIPDGTEADPDPGMSAILTAAENFAVPLESFSPGGVFNTGRFQLVEVSTYGLGGQARRWREGTSRGGIRFSGSVPWAGVTQDVNESSRMVLCHEISHQFLDVADRYGQRYPIRGDVVVDRTWVGDWEKFVIERVSGPGPALNGDQIMLRAHNGLYMSIAAGPVPLPLSPNLINTEGPEVGEARVFTITNLSGGDLVNGSHVALRSSAGLYVTAVLGGDSTLIADASSIREWEEFEVGRTSGTGNILSGDTITLKSSGGFYVVAETDSRTKPRDPTTNANDYQRGYFWGSGGGQGGDFDNASSNYRAVMLSLWDRLRLGWVRARFLTPDNRGCYQIRPFIDSRQALILFDPQNPGEWYTVENREHRENVDEVPSSGIVISWLCEDEGYWQWWFNRANDPDYQVLYPAVISAAASAVPPNAMARALVLHPDLITKRNDPNAAFTNQELVLPLGNGDPSRFHLSFHSGAGPNITMCIR